MDQEKVNLRCELGQIPPNLLSGLAEGSAGSVLSPPLTDLGYRKDVKGSERLKMARKRSLTHGRLYDKVSGSPRNTNILEIIFKLDPFVKSMVIHSKSSSCESIVTLPYQSQMYRSKALCQHDLRSTGIFAVRWAKQARQRKRDNREPHSHSPLLLRREGLMNPNKTTVSRPNFFLNE